MSEMVPSAVRAGSLDLYFKSANTYPILSQDEEIALALEFRDHKSKEAAQKLVLSHIRFVVHIAKKYAGYGLPEDDLIQEGAVGLMKAVRGFDPDKGNRLATFAIHWIKAEIHEYILRNWRIVKIATTKAQRKLFFNLRRMKGNKTWLDRDDISLIAKQLNVSEADVLSMESRLANVDVGFDGQASDDGDDAAHIPSYYLTDGRDDVESIVAEDELSTMQSKRLHKAVEKLSDRSKDIISSRWLVDGKAQTLSDLAKKYSVSTERIRQLEKQALNVLRSEMSLH